MAMRVAGAAAAARPPACQLVPCMPCRATHCASHPGLRIKEAKEVYEGEVTELTPVETENPGGGYGKVRRWLLRGCCGATAGCWMGVVGRRWASEGVGRQGPGSRARCCGRLLVLVLWSWKWGRPMLSLPTHPLCPDLPRLPCSPGQVVSHVVIGLRTVKGSKQLKLDPSIHDALQVGLFTGVLGRMWMCAFAMCDVCGAGVALRRERGRRGRWIAGLALLVGADAALSLGPSPFHAHRYPIVFQSQKEKVAPGDVIYIEANSGAVKRVGRCACGLLRPRPPRLLSRQSPSRPGWPANACPIR